MKREKAVKVSIIIPCYNTERFLHECLDSIVNQTLKEIEIICVDDGSTDGTSDILREYSQRDGRFKLLSQENQFAGVARNKGMEVAKGKYLYICDSDDFFEPMMLEKGYRKAEADNADICLFGGGDYDMRFGLCSYRYGLRHKYLPKEMPFSRDDVLQDIYQLFPIVSYSKLYKRSFIESHSLKFQALSTAEDVFFNCCAIVVAERITVVDDWLWTYRKGTSTSLVERMDQKPFCIDEAYRGVKEFLVEKQLYSQVARSFKELALGSGVYSLDMMKTKEAWLRCVLFLKEKYIPEFELLECFDFLDPDDYNLERLQFIVDNSIDKLYEYKPKLRIDELVRIPEWEYFLNENPVKVSIIIPVHNCEDYLEECLRSVLDQTLTDIEIICVNKDSFDNSLDILNRFSQKDGRIKIISQENKGLSSARNAGLEFAKGEYVMFVDSDDLLIKMAVDHLYRKAEYNDLDQLLCEGVVIYESMSLYNRRKEMVGCYKFPTEYPCGVYQGSELLAQLSLNVCTGMQTFRLDFLKDNDIYFDEDVTSDNTAFIHKALINAKRVMIHKEELYIKRIRENSILEVKNEVQY